MNYLVLDIGGTFIKYAMMNEEGECVFQDKTPTPLTSLADFYVVMDKLVNKDVAGIALSFPGPVQAESGIVIDGGSLKYMSGLPLVQLLNERYHLPCSLENDARCAALAEVWKGNLQGVNVGLVMVFGTGIGSSLTIDGKLFKGAHDFSGEISCMLTRNFEELGWKASFHHEVGIPFLLQKVKEAKGIKADFDGKALFALLEENDEIVEKLFEEYCKALVKQIFNIQCMMDPQRICIGGGVSMQPYFIQAIKEALDALYEKLPVNAPKPVLMPCKFHNDSNLIGALYHYMQINKVR